MTALPGGAFSGTLLHTPVCGKVELLRDALVEVDATGAIVAVHRHDSRTRLATVERHRAAGTLVALAEDTYLLPGMVDLHVHAPQWPQLGTALDLPLEEWLQVHTFPLEARYADTAYAREVYASLVDGLLANGTTTALYFATVHLEATCALAEICLERAQRALIGRVAMDNPAECPGFYRDASAAVAEQETRAFIARVRSMAGNEQALIRPVITPRFIPSCTDELLHALGRLAGETGCHVQTHCSESDWEHAYVLERCGMSDTAALAQFGLLTRRTVLAHGNFVGDEDVARIVAAGAAIAHCPLSNVYFSDAVFPLRRLLTRGVHVGLGTDIAGGASPSLLENARHAIIASRNLESGVDASLPRERRRVPDSRIDAPTAFWLATVGGGVALDLPLGMFAPGYQFDALVVDANAAQGNLRLTPQAEAAEVLQKILYHAARVNIAQVWVAGRQVRGPQVR